jgi:hypothetical protein
MSTAERYVQEGEFELAQEASQFILEITGPIRRLHCSMDLLTHPCVDAGINVPAWEV